MKDLKLNNTHEFNHFNGSQTAYKYSFGTIYTEGIKYLSDTYECYWFLDLIAIHAKDIKDEEFQVWNLSKKGESSEFKVTVTDGNNNILKEIEIPFSDFKASSLDVWFINNTMMLPSEY